MNNKKKTQLSSRMTLEKPTTQRNYREREREARPLKKACVKSKHKAVINET